MIARRSGREARRELVYSRRSLTRGKRNVAELISGGILRFCSDK